MYLLPLLFSNLHLGLDSPFDSLDPASLGRTNLARPEDLASRVLDRYYPVSFDRGVLDFYRRPWANLGLLNSKRDVLCSTSIDDDFYNVTINVEQYKPEEVTVKVVDRWVVVEAKHEVKKDDGDLGIVSRQFVRRYLLPNRADVDQVTSTISSDGILKITAPLKPADERVIKIEQTGQPAVPPGRKEAGASETTGEKKAEDNEVVREEVTATQAQEAGPKPEKR